MRSFLKEGCRNLYQRWLAERVGEERVREGGREGEGVWLFSFFPLLRFVPWA
jgi:hypothetical protein